MRGKDFLFKMIEKNASLKRTTRECIAVVANRSIKKEGKLKLVKYDTLSGSVYQFYSGRIFR